MSSNRIKRFHMYAGVDLIGAKTSMAEKRGISLEATALGIKMVSKATNRVVVIPYSNVKGFELYPESDTQVDAPAELVEEPKRRGRKAAVKAE